MKDYSKMSDDELKRSFLANGSNFFGWNSGKNTPNILIQLTEGVGMLNQNIKAASDSSTELAKALNRITRTAVVISAIGLVIAVAAVVVQIVK